jgi:serine/threonine protein kinase
MTNLESAWFRDPDAVLTAMRSDDSALSPSVPGYEASVELHRGSHTLVLLGRRTKTGERVAIKVLLSDAWVSESAKRRFDREIELVSSLDHPSIVRVLDRGSSADGHPYLVMEYVEGVPLDEYIAPPRDDGGPVRRSPAARRDALSLFVTICDAVGHAHQRGIIHRDLKPSNIRVSAAGQPRILDFGIARLVGDAGPLSLAVTVTSQFLGTPAYAAPEQFLGRPHEIDTRADVYALGVILYQIVTGRLPYRDTDTIGGLIRGITAPGGEIVRPNQVAHDVSADLQAVVLKALAREPAERYQTVNAFADDVRAVLAARPTTARPPTRREELSRAIRQNRAVAVLIGCIVVGSVGFAVTTKMMSLHIDKARLDAVAASEQARTDAIRSQAVLDFLTGMIFHTHVPSDEAQHAASQLILDRAHERVTAYPPDDPRIRAELHNILGRSYYSIEASDRAIEHFRAALAVDGLKDQPARRLHIQVLLSLLLLEQGQVAQAEEVAHQFLSERRGTRSVINKYAATTMLVLGRGMNHDVGNLALAEAILRDVWTSIDADVDPQQVHVAIAIDFAEILVAQGKRIEEAVPILENGIAISTRIDGPNHHHTLKARASLAHALQREQRLNEALLELTDVTNRCIASLGESSPQTLAAMMDLGRLQISVGDRASAHGTLARVLPRCVETLGPENPMTLQVQRLLGEIASSDPRAED